ncbi:MAG: S8 family serine peptidase [Muribaculaceae bacterium]
MKIKILLLLALLPYLTASAAVSDSRTRLETARIARESAMHKAKAVQDGQTLYTSMIVRFDSDDDLRRITDELGGVIFHTRADMALCCIPRDKVEELSRGNYVDSYAISRKATANCDRLREGVRVTRTENDKEIPTLPVTGKGVVAGICDIGLDPSHIAFKDRLGLVSTYVDSLAIREVWAPGSALDTGAALKPDTDDEWHGTHVLNILGGSDAGNPYHGIATGSVLAVSRSYLTDVAMLSGIEDIIAYAKERDMPCVINLSVGSYLGPHDGSDLMNRYLSLLGREAVIVFSAGNNGYKNVTLRHTLGPDSPGTADGLPTVGTMWESLDTWDGFNIRGAMDIWSADTQTCDVRIVVWDQIDRKFVYRTDWYGPATGKAEGEAVFDAADLPETAALLKGSRVYIAWGTSPENNRYNIALEYAMISEATLPGTKWARYVMGWEVRGRQGFSFDAYTDGTQTYMRNYGTPGKIDGTPELSISDLCCSDAVIGVGAWNTRNVAPIWGSDKEQTFNFDLDTPAAFSSYGTLRDGRVKPDICAPGNTVISAISNAYIAKHPDVRTIAYRQTVGGKEYSWFQECGTSMASPAVAGVIALWMQAHPSLDVFTAGKVAAETAYIPGDSANPRWGAAGAIDALAGLNKLNEMAGVDAIVPDTPAEGPAGYFDLTGRRVTNPGPGLYIERRGRHVRKIIIR